ncbi:MAG: hypothetical protein NWE95_00545 [Candidatus Bathyarchaeota archaeon]|nr:hypothetical protein [Candidatus Bathyarchaeota archaeon]
MLQKWLSPLKVDPIPVLLSSGNKAIEYFTKRNLLDETVEPIDYVWQLPEVQKTFQKQQPDGTWKHTGKKTVNFPKYHYKLVETWKVYRLLVEHYEVTKEHEGSRRAAEFLFSCQTDEGDFRGMLANQYATYYTGAILATLIKAGYENDDRVKKAFDWLLSMRQNDGGWTIPILTHKLDRQTWLNITSTYAEPLVLDKSKPFSHNCTDMVLRAFAAHPTYRCSKVARRAADLLKSRFFQPDVYASYQDARYWVRFRFWWTNIVTSLDSLSLIGYSKDDTDVKEALRWLVENQLPNGLWKMDYAQGAKEKVGVTSEKLWLALSVARIFKRFYEKI